MARSRLALPTVALLAPFVATACSGGGGASPAGPVTMLAAATPPAPNVDSATLGPNSPVPAAANTTIASMAVGTVLPLRQAVVSVEVNNVVPAASVETGGSTLTYLGTQTVNGVTGPEFELKVPNATSGIDVTIKPDGASASNSDFALIRGKVVDALNYALTFAWSAEASETYQPLFSMGVTGYQTPTGILPTSGQATYLGNGTNGAKGSVQGLIFTNPYTQLYVPPATVSGSASTFSVNFGSGQVTGTLSGLTATPAATAGAAGTPQPWNQINIAGTLSGAVLSGSTSTPAQPGGGLGFGTGATGKFDGALYGPNGEELGAVWSLRDPSTLNTAFGVVSATKQ